MTDRDEFMKVVNKSEKKMWEVASGLGMSPQALYNKLGNVTQFTQTELANFRTMFPDVTDEAFKKIFFASELASNEK